MILSAENLKAKNWLTMKKITLTPAEGDKEAVECYIREIVFGDYNEINKVEDTDNMSKAVAMVKCAICDEKGDTLFKTDEEATATLKGLPVAWLTKLIEEVTALNGLAGNDDIKAEVKNSTETPTSGSSTVSA